MRAPALPLPWDSEPAMLDELQPLTFELTVMRLVSLAAACGGTLDAGDVEEDEHLARNRQLTNAAARMLAGGVGVQAEPTGAGWFPFRHLKLTDLPPALEPEPE